MLFRSPSLSLTCPCPHAAGGGWRRPEPSVLLPAGSHLKSSSCQARCSSGRGPALRAQHSPQGFCCPGKAALVASWVAHGPESSPLLLRGLSEHPRWKEADSLPVSPADEVAFARPSPVRTGAREGLRGQGSQSGSSGPRGQSHKARCGADRKSTRLNSSH